jgi:hypothetical protein
MMHRFEPRTDRNVPGFAVHSCRCPTLVRVDSAKESMDDALAR